MGDSHNTTADDESHYEEKKILGVCWNFINNQLVFDLSDIAQIAVTLEPMNRNKVGLSTNFYDPLGLVSPVTVQFKLLFKALCEGKVEWDQQLLRELLKSWNLLLTGLQKTKPMLVPRYYLSEITDPINQF